MKLQLRHVFLFTLLLATLSLAGCGSSSPDPLGAGLSGGVPSASAANGQISGAVLLAGQPVPGAQLQFRQPGKASMSLTADERGEFTFQAALAGGELSTTVDGVTLSAEIPAGAQFVWVNELSTLVHEYREIHPDKTYSEANAAVAGALGSPINEDITQLSDSDIFDPATFEQVAAAQGGLGLFLPRVAGEIQDVGQFDFSAPDEYRVLQIPGQDPHQRTVESTPPTLPKSPFNLVGEYLAKKFLGELEKKAFGWFFGLFGSNSGPSLGDVVERLSAIENAINLLAEQLKLEFAQAELREAINTLSNTSTNLTTFSQFQRDANALRPPVTEEPSQTPPAIATYLADQRFNANSARVYANEFFNYMLNRTPTTNIITRYNKFTMEQLGRSEPSTALLSYDIRSNGITRKLQNNLNFSLGNIDLAMDMLANAAHSTFLKPQNLTGEYPGNSLPDEIALARAFILASVPQNVAAANNDSAALRKRALQLVPPTLPRDDIMTLPIANEADTPTIAYRGAWSARERNPSIAAIFPLMHYSVLQRIGAPWADFQKWMLPTRAQMQTIEAMASAAGGGDPKAGLVRLGFFPNVGSVPSHFFFREGYLRSVEDRIVGLRVFLQVHELGRGAPVELLYSRLNTSYKFVGALFLRGSLSGGTPEQANTILATGTSVRPALTVTEPTPGKLHADATYSFSNGQTITVDVTDRVEWLSSDPAQVEVSNLDADANSPAGTLISKSPAKVTITAALLVDSANPQSASSYVTAARPAETSEAAVLKTIEISPRNRIYTSVGSPAAYLFCTGYLGSDRLSIETETFLANDLTSSPKLKWTLLGPDGQTIDPNRASLSSAFANNQPTGGILRLLDPTLPTGTYTVRAEYFSEADQTTPQFVDEVKIGVQVQ